MGINKEELYLLKTGATFVLTLPVALSLHRVGAFINLLKLL